MPVLNPLVLNTGSPPIPQVQAWGRAYAGGRGPLIDLCQAVPGYAPPPALLDRLSAAAAEPLNAKYGLIPGDTTLRDAYAAHLSTLYGGQVAPSQVAITAGCNQAFFAAMLLLVPRGGAVLLPTPWYYNHRMTCDMLGLDARALPTRTEDGFIPDPDLAEQLIDDQVRAIVLITPNNPTGAIYPPQVLARFRDLCRRRKLWLVLDETYRDFLPAGQAQPHTLLQDAAWPDTVVQLYSFSKAYAVPGHRLGALAAAEATVAEMTKALDCLHICPQRGAQSAMTWGLGALAEWRDANRAEMNRRAAFVRDRFRQLSGGQAPGWRIDSLGAYFAYVRHPFPGVDAWRVVEHLALEHGVMLLPASAFAGSADHVRVSFANVDVDGLDALATRLAGVDGAGLSG